MRFLLLWATSIILLTGTTAYAQSNDEILSQYQKGGLTFVRIKAVPDQEIGGMLVKEIYNRLKIPVTIRIMPGKRALDSASTGLVDGESVRIAKIQELFPTLIRLSPPISFVEGSVFVKNRDIKVDGWSSLSQYKIGRVRGVQYVADGTKGFKHVQVVQGDALISILNAGRVDLVVTARYNGLYQLRKLNLQNLIRPLSPPVITLDLHNYLHVKHKSLVPIVEELLREMHTNGELRELRDQFMETTLANINSK